MENYEARVNITWNGQNGDLPDPVNFDAPDGDVINWVQEAVQAGSVPGIQADGAADFEGYVVDRYTATDDVPFHRILCRPKTAFG